MAVFAGKTENVNIANGNVNKSKADRGSSVEERKKRSKQFSDFGYRG